MWLTRLFSSGRPYFIHHSAVGTAYGAWKTPTIYSNIQLVPGTSQLRSGTTLTSCNRCLREKIALNDFKASHSRSANVLVSVVLVRSLRHRKTSCNLARPAATTCVQHLVLTGKFIKVAFLHKLYLPQICNRLTVNKSIQIYLPDGVTTPAKTEPNQTGTFRSEKWREL